RVCDGPPSPKGMPRKTSGGGTNAPISYCTSDLAGAAASAARIGAMDRASSRPRVEAATPAVAATPLVASTFLPLTRRGAVLVVGDEVGCGKAAARERCFCIKDPPGLRSREDTPPIHPHSGPPTGGAPCRASGTVSQDRFPMSARRAASEEYSQ